MRQLRQVDRQLFDGFRGHESLKDDSTLLAVEVRAQCRHSASAVGCVSIHKHTVAFFALLFVSTLPCRRCFKASRSERSICAGARRPSRPARLWHQRPHLSSRQRRTRRRARCCAHRRRRGVARAVKRVARRRSQRRRSRLSRRRRRCELRNVHRRHVWSLGRLCWCVHAHWRLSV